MEREEKIELHTLGPPEIEKVTGVKRGWVRRAFLLGHLQGIRVGNGRKRVHFRATEAAIRKWLSSVSHGEAAPTAPTSGAAGRTPNS